MICSTSSGEYLGWETNSFQACVLRRIATFDRERVVGQTFGHDDVRQAIDQRNVGSRLELKVIVGFDMRRRANQIDRARIEQ